MSKQRCTYIGSSHSFLLLGRLRLCTTSPSLLRNATSPSRRGLGKTGKLYAMPRAPLLGQRRRPPPVAETGKSCWGSGQQDASAKPCTKRTLGAATRTLSSECETERLYRAGPALQNYTQLIFYQQFHLDARVFVIFSGGSRARGRYRPNWRNCRRGRCTVSGAGSASTEGSRSFRRSR